MSESTLPIGSTLGNVVVHQPPTDGNRGPRATFRVLRSREEMFRRLDGSRSLGLLAERDVARLYAILRAELRRLPLTVMEWAFLAEVCHLDGPWDPASIPHFAQQVAERLESGNWATWRVAHPDELRPALLGQLTAGQSLAIVDAIERAGVLRKADPALTFHESLALAGRG